MKLINFPEQNQVIAEDQLEYLPMPAHVTSDEQGRVVCCWKLTMKERIKLLFTGKLWHHILTFNRGVQPQLLEVNTPFTTTK